jgi:hypothetical protein
VSKSSFYLRDRYYDPATARFLTRDPLDALTRSAYGYAVDDPANHADPTGLCGWTDPLGCVGDAASATASHVGNHAGDIATVASLVALAVPGVDVIDLGVVAGISINGAVSLTANAVAITAGDLASGEDISNGHYVSGALDIIGTVGGLSALHLQGLANLNRAAAAAAWRSSYLQPWFLENAASYARYARLVALGAFGVGSIPSFSLVLSRG